MVIRRVVKRVEKSRVVRTKIDSLPSFFNNLHEIASGPEFTDVYRGHSDEKYKLVPSLFRSARGQRDEKNILRELLSLHPNEFREDKGVFEQLVRMQHFSLPTRLLDVSFNPLVALYFACSSNNKKQGEIIKISTLKRHVRYFDSDTVSCVANLSSLTSRERNEIRKIESDDGLNSTSLAGKRLLQFIRAEKSYFLPEIKVRHLKSIHVVNPKKNNRRVLAQQGAFLIFGLIKELEDENEFGIIVKRFIIPASAKQNIMRDLDMININASSLFPEMESAAKYIMSKIIPLED
jgi:hypothetical protein